MSKPQTVYRIELNGNDTGFRCLSFRCPNQYWFGEWGGSETSYYDTLAEAKRHKRLKAVQKLIKSGAEVEIKIVKIVRQWSPARADDPMGYHFWETLSREVVHTLYSGLTVLDRIVGAI